MEIVHLIQQRRFGPDKMQKVPVFNSDKLFFDQYCLLPGQHQRVHTHAEEDKIYVVLEGAAMFEIDGEEQRLGPGSAVIARAGTAHGVRNDSAREVVLLVAMAPRPNEF